MYSTIIEQNQQQQQLQQQNDNSGISVETKRKYNDFSNMENQRKKHAFNIVSTVQRPPRILTRRYTLTKTGYKFIDIGITVDYPSCVDIILGDCQGKEISFSPESWKKLIDQKNTIISILQSDDVDKARAPIEIDNIALRFGKINNLPVLRLEASSIRIILSLITVLVMFDHDYCINRIIQSLNGITRNVETKYSRFLEIASKVVNSQDVPQAIRKSEFFDCNDIIDCELAVVCFGI